MRKCKLGDYIQIKHGYPFKSEFFSSEGKYIILTPGNFYEEGGFKRTPGKEKFYTSEFPQEYLCKKDDLIVVMTEQVRGLLGSTALVPENNIFLHNQRIGLISYDEKHLSRDFLNYLFRTKTVRNQLEGSASGTKIKHTSPERICAVEVELPDLDNQVKIGKLLKNIDDKINTNRNLILALESMAKTLYDYWFVQFDFPNDNGHPYKTSGGKMEWNEELGKEIPVGWKPKRIKDVLSVVTGKEDANFATANGKFKFFTCADDALKCDVATFDGHAVLLAGNGNFNVKHYTGKFNAYQRTYVLIPNNNKLYGVLYLSVLRMVDTLTKHSTGSIVKFITKGDVENIKILEQPNKELYSKINVLMDKIEKLQEENERLTGIRDFLLPLLMNGQVTFG